MRWSRVVPIAIASAVTVAAVADVVARELDQHPAAAPSHAATAAPSRPPILAGLDGTGLHDAGPAPTSIDLAPLIDPAVERFPAGEQLVGSVVDIARGTTLWSRKPDLLMAPASTTKLLTAVAALDSLGPDYQLTTATRQQGDTVYLVGGGDPTLIATDKTAALPAYPQPASLAGLAEQTAAALTPGVPIRLRIDTSAWTGPTAAQGWQDNYVTEGDVTPPSALELDGGRLNPRDFDSERTPTPAPQAADAFVELLRQDGVMVKGTVKEATAPPTAMSLASVSSPPLSALVDRMLTASDNDLAEALGRAVAAHEGLPATFTGAASAVTAAVTSLGVPSTALSLYDASGLSHDDRIAPSALVTVLSAAVSDPALRPIFEALPVGGFTGTLAARFRDKPDRVGAGIVRAKTGTLTGVSTLAGVVVDASGRLLGFALMAAGQQSESDVEAGLDAIASALARLE